MMMKRRRVSPRRAARMLGVHPNTVYSWCRRAVDGEPTKLSDVERNNATGYYSIDRAEVVGLRDGAQADGADS